MAAKPKIRIKGVAVAAAAAPISRAASTGGTGFDASKSQRRLRAWRPTREHVNSMLAYGGELALSRAREQIRNNPYAASASSSFVANVIGAGIKPSSLVDDRAVKAEIQMAWLDWTDEADADGVTDFYGQQALAAKAMFDGGECFVRFRPRRPSDGLSVPLQLQILEAEQLPVTKTEPAANGNDIRCGIEFDRIGRRVAYHFYRTHPGDSTIVNGTGGETVRVLASEVMHIFAPLRPGQIRGVPWLTPSLVRLFLIDSYDDAELDRKKTAAMFAGFIKKPEPEELPLDAKPDDVVTGEDGSAMLGLQPGTLQDLLPGEEIEFAQPADVGGQYEAFQYRNLVAAAAGVGMPYQAMTGDVMKANYSNVRAGLVEARRRWEQLQHDIVIFQLVRPVWRRWMRDAVLAGRLQLVGFAQNPQAYLRAKFTPPGWDWVDPLKDQQAARMAVRSGFLARSDVIDEQGLDAEEVDLRIRADNERADELGIVVDSDARRRTSSGAATDDEDEATAAGTGGDADSSQDEDDQEERESA